MLLKGKVALVTGASRGIGAATAKLFAQEGASVAVNYNRSAEAAQAVVEEIIGSGGNAVAAQANVTDPLQVETMVQQVTADFGPIDVLVLNAAISFPIVPFTKYTWDDFESKLTGEMKAAFFCCQEVVPAMRKRMEGSIIAVSSTLSRMPGDGFCAHSAAKSALDGFMKSLALELGPKGIRVNTVAPGLTLTDATAFLPDEQKEKMANMTPLRRNAEPEDVAGAILLMASDQARFITASYVPVCGGGLML